MKPLIFSLFLLPFSLFSQHGMMYHVSMSEQFDASSNIIEGEVISSESVWNIQHNYIYTLHTVKVSKVFMGESRSHIVIATVGGRVGKEALRVSDRLSLLNGDKGLFFLKPTRANLDGGMEAYDVVSDKQGFYRYDVENDLVIRPFYRSEGIETNFYLDIHETLGLTYFEIEALNLQPAERFSSSQATPTFSPASISAGTESVVTISGTSFGSTPGRVKFKWADDGGVTFQSALASQILSWTDTEIRVEVPAYAGTGIIRVTGADSVSQETATPLIITFAQSNGESFGDAVLTNLIDQNTLGGYSWHLHEDFANDAQAQFHFMSAMSTWKCNSEVNWRVLGNTMADSSVVDGINVVRFDNGNELPMGVLGQCASYTFLCGTPEVEAIVELDMTVDDGTTFHFGSGAPIPGQFDFESVVVHELGHGHQLNHVIDSSDIMYYGLAPQVVRRALGTNDVAGSIYVQTRCAADATCTFGRTVNLNCSVISTSENTLAETLTIYPNPARDVAFVIASANALISITDLFGRKLAVEMMNTGDRWELKVEELPSGNYFIQIVERDSQRTHRLIIQ
ncbi:T9SS type A sorting domain-containing protein [Phaeocystidibacter luteus]|uniref:T9SS type A sorting domain-containing protein n=1 Tax=Phaeocystidibacter luteus TaxID=911197 RepID=A0A6N6RI05_9FLAO|nr:T9SS type A sorting domain-containing protein [Phaeocystidibacter luteus]KAB2809984.1 T9SS type A sorting domain-containing protein [Phaeocystidibacter luteus]